MTSPKQVFKVLIVALLAACALAFATRHKFYVEALVDPFFGLALASVVILHFRLRPSWMDGLLVSVSTLLLAFLDFHVLHYPPTLMAWFSFFGVSSLLLLGAACVLVEDSKRKLLLYGWIPAVLFLASDWFASNMLGWVADLHPRTLDLYLLSFDASMHVQLSFLVGQIFDSVRWLRWTGLYFYMGLAIPITLVYAGRLVRFGTKAFSAMLAFLVTGPAGILFYFIFPACGPVHMANRYFPFHPLSISQTSRLVLEPIAIAGARNAIPSLHMAWTLLAWWYSRGLSWWERGIALAFVAFTVVATLGTGEHYFIDLVVAFPFALMVEAACAYELRWRDSGRLQAAGFGLALVLLWLAGLRFANRLFWTSPVVPWSLAAATIALVELRRRKLLVTMPLQRTESESRGTVAIEAN